MRILIVSDAWVPQINGVVRTLQKTRAELEALGHSVEVVGPERFRTMPCPTYPEIPLALFPARGLVEIVDAWQPESIHIATEGPLGQAARKLCRKRGWAFTTSFHTRFPEYIEARFGIPERWIYRFMRGFHNQATRTLVTTPSMKARLEERGFRNLVIWSRGVDTGLFHPHEGRIIDLPRPIFMNIGRVAVEKNLEAFLKLDLPGSKLVVGDGPLLEQLRRAYPEVTFVGARQGEELARYYALGDVFVFPSRTDTFGLVLLEALASGVPVAAFPVEGPIDVVTDPAVGMLDEDLRAACLGALGKDRDACRTHALGFSWSACARTFQDNLVPLTD